MEQQQEHYPIDHSLLGNNTVYIKCEFRGAHQNYAICLNVNKAQDEGRRTPDDYCFKDIKDGRCYAAKMREEELAAGHTLYYKPRVKIDVPPAPKTYTVPSTVKASSGYKRGFEHAGSVLGKESAPTPKVIKPVASKSPVIVKNDDVMDLGALVSQMAKDHQDVPKQEVVEAPAESMLEKARRIREQRGNI